MNAAVGRRLLAEFTGTGLLVAIVVGSGIAATRLTTDGALRLLVNSLVTAMGLAVLILIFIQAGGAHFNPIVTRRRLAPRPPHPPPLRPRPGLRRHGLPAGRYQPQLHSGQDLDHAYLAVMCRPATANAPTARSAESAIWPRTAR